MTISLLDLISRVFFVGGSIVVAWTIMWFFWNLVMYATGKDDDAHRAHAKKSVINTTLWVVCFMIIWWLIASIGRSLGI